jgi:hypothetical protein
VIIAAIVVAAVVVSVLIYIMRANEPPVIAGLETAEQRVFPSGSTEIVCTATDPDGDRLSYAWSAGTGTIEGDGATVTWIAPDYEGLFSISVTVSDGRRGEATKHVTIRVKENEPPEIDGLTTDNPWTTPSGTLQVSCSASDPDGHALSYEWMATGGDITGTGAAATWTAPEELGVYEITVVVSDGYGGTATGALPVSVVTGQPPIIEDLVVTADHCYLKKQAFGFSVGREQEYIIECIASHPDGFELTYEWESEAGEVSETSEDGSMITWIAPNTSVYMTITVTVSDSAGNTISQSVALNVVSCSHCTFGSC